MLKGKLTPTRFLQGTISKVAEVVGSNIQPIRIYENGVYEVSGDVDGFNPVYVDTPEPKEEQEKTVTITENGIIEVLPDNNKTLSKVTVDVQVDCGEEPIDLLQYVKTARMLFHSAKSFPSKAVVNLPNVTTVYQAFAYWDTPPIPIVEELTVTAPNISVGNNQACMGQMFTHNNGVTKVILNMPDESQYMNNTFSSCGILEEVVLNFSTKKISDYTGAFTNCKKLKKIDGVLDFSSATNVTYMFGCNELEYVRFAPNTVSISISLVACSKLTSESIQSIIDGLAAVTTAKTLTLAKTIVLTDVQKKTIQDKGWTLVQ
jgi:hypothetical protein